LCPVVCEETNKGRLFSKNSQELLLKRKKKAIFHSFWVFFDYLLQKKAFFGTEKGVWQGTKTVYCFCKKGNQFSSTPENSFRKATKDGL